MRLRLHRPSPAMVVALCALFVAMGGTGYAAATGAIDSREVKNNTIRGKDVRNGSLEGRDVKNRSLTPIDFKGSVRGRTGPAGATGAVGPRGATGAVGPTGGAGRRAIPAQRWPMPRWTKAET